MKEKGQPTRGVKLETTGEGQCPQILHVGAYADEARSLEKLHVYAKQHGLRFRGRHHEIPIGSAPRAGEPAAHDPAAPGSA